MTALLVLLALAVAGLTAALVWTLRRSVASPAPQIDTQLDALKKEWSERLGVEIARVWTQMQGQVQTTDKAVSQKLEETNRTYADIKQQLATLTAATKQVEAIGRDVVGLQDLLRAPKIRGGLGEFFLGDLLAQILPQGGDFYALQYEFANGERVDAAIRLGGRLVPVDAKFPLEQFQRLQQVGTEEERTRARKEFVRGVKKRIDEIALKYIRPAEGTMDFALMYIPAEAVYYETILRTEGVIDEDGIFQHAVQRRVIPVSPNSFYAYLQVILFGLRGFQIEQRTKEIVAGLSRLQLDLGRVQEAFDKAGKQLHNAVANFDEADRTLDRFDDRLKAIEAPTTTQPMIEKLLTTEGGGT